jgi:mannobiose 2-epimerase
MLSAVNTAKTIEILEKYRTELNLELASILDWWMRNMPDDDNGGFYGSVQNDNTALKQADKGIVLNSRILWAFAEAYAFTGKIEYEAISRHAFDYIREKFWDHQYGAVYWSVDAKGTMKDGKKQVYGLAFCIYGLAAYYRAVNDPQALQMAIHIYHLIEGHNLDKKHGGYLEALARDWSPLEDLRLSEKDSNAKKTMNTHLHLVEAYCGLYQSWPDNRLQQKIIDLLSIFSRYIINSDSHHLNLFMDESWRLQSTLVSFGHDIEAAWLLQECACITGDQASCDYFKKEAINLVEAATWGLDHSDGGLWYEYEPASSEWIKQKHSWPQAEAMVGYFNAWQLKGDKKYLSYSIGCFEFVKKELKDYKYGEWLWGIESNGRIMQKEKTGFWKCPYHSCRACMEISRRISSILTP